MSRPENKSLLLFSGGQSELRQPYYHYADGWLPEYLKERLGEHSKIMFIPWALWAGHSAEDMFRYGQEQWGRIGIGIEPLQRQANMTHAIERSDAIIVGGGSIHMLVQSLVQHDLMPAIRKSVEEGALYIGTSAGAVLACPTRLSALEPPPIALERYKTLNLIPFQITPHYYELNKDSHHSGPTPVERIMNYAAFNLNPNPVLALKDGSWLHITDRKITFFGEKSALIVTPDRAQYRIAAGTDLSELLNLRSHYYRRTPISG